MNYYNGVETIGQIVSEFHGASNLFKECGIDFCCGGDRKLTEALKQQQIDEKPFLSRLNSMYEEAQQHKNLDKDWRKVASGELIEHILAAHHAYLNQELPILSQFVTKILRVHGQAHPELAALHKLFHQMKTELEQHLISEEEAVFPLIKQYGLAPSDDLLHQIAATIDGLEAEHSGVGGILKEMRLLTSSYTLPDGACGTYSLAFRKLEELEADLFQHIHLENNILFPRFSTSCCS
jgi:regulator of cell morphogenesis and NO signaling